MQHFQEQLILGEVHSLEIHIQTDLNEKLFFIQKTLYVPLAHQ
jgi:hypothetical protein